MPAKGAHRLFDEVATSDASTTAATSPPRSPHAATNAEAVHDNNNNNNSNRSSAASPPAASQTSARDTAAASLRVPRTAHADPQHGMTAARRTDQDAAAAAVAARAATTTTHAASPSQRGATAPPVSDADTDSLATPSPVIVATAPPPALLQHQQQQQQQQQASTTRTPRDEDRPSSSPRQKQQQQQPADTGALVPAVSTSTTHATPPQPPPAPSAATAAAATTLVVEVPPVDAVSVVAPAWLAAENSAARHYYYDHHRHRHGRHGDDNDDDDDEHAVLHWGALMSYIFPRLDGALAQWSMRDHRPLYYPHPAKATPNSCEIALAYVLRSDVRVTVYLALTFFALVFTVVAIPIAQLDEVGGGCYTYWGYKLDCENTAYTCSASNIRCDAVATRLRAAAAFAIISLVCLLVLFTLQCVFVCCVRRAPRRVASVCARVTLIVLGVVTFVMQLVTWALVANLYTARYCEDTSRTRTLAYGPGFGLFITAWMLNVCGVLVVAALPSSLVERD